MSTHQQKCEAIRRAIEARQACMRPGMNQSDGALDQYEMRRALADLEALQEIEIDYRNAGSVMSG